MEEKERIERINAVQKRMINTKVFSQRLAKELHIFNDLAKKEKSFIHNAIKFNEKTNKFFDKVNNKLTQIKTKNKKIA